MTPTVVVADGDAEARARVGTLLSRDRLVSLAGEAATLDDTVDLVHGVAPDIACLAIETPVFGLEVARRVVRRPVLVFTATSDTLAAAAFDVGAADYIVAPFTDARFRTAIRRALVLVDRSARPTAPPDRRSPLDSTGERLFLPDKDRILPVVASRVIRCEASGDYVDVRTSDRSFLVRMRLQDLEERLSDTFLRIHRSHLVNLEHVDAFEPHDSARLAAVMSDGSRIVASRARSRELRRLAR